MILYNVTINVEIEIADEWLQWMKDVHIPHVMATGRFLEHHMLRMIGDEDTGGVTYSVQYLCSDMKTFEDYRDSFSPALQAETSKKYGNRLVAFRTLHEVVI